MNFKDDLIEYKCLCCNKNYQHKFDEKLKEQFFNTYKFCSHGNKFILLLQKGVYPYEYMDDWEKFNGTSLPEKEDFYRHLNMQDVFEDFRSVCLEIYELDPAKFLPAPGLAWQTALKKTKVKLDLLTDIDMLLMVEKCIRGGICHSIY